MSQVKSKKIIKSTKPRHKFQFLDDTTEGYIYVNIMFFLCVKKRVHITEDVHVSVIEEMSDAERHDRKFSIERLRRQISLQLKKIHNKQINKDIWLSSGASNLDELMEKGFEPSVDEKESVVDIFDGKKLVLLIKQLPAKYERVLRMRFLQSLSISEISILLSSSKNTVAVQIHRGLEKLKLLYADKKARNKIIS
jgi:RNA polymerase sigma factor (sigma-70 family)